MKSSSFDISNFPALASFAAAPAHATTETDRSHDREPEQSEGLGTILLVDDEIVTRTLLGNQLRTVGYDVIDVENGHEALTKVLKGQVDLVLMDISMPVMDGFSALRMMRQLHDPASLPIVMMTSNTEPEHIVRCFDNGASDYLTKPVEQSGMLARLSAQFKLKQTLVELRESEERYALASQGTRDGIWDWNIETGTVYLSPRWLAMIGVGDTEALTRGTAWIDLVFHEDRDRVRADLELHLCGETDHFETELRMPDQTGGYRWMLCRGLAVRDEHGMATRIAGSLTDITEGKVADALTHLPNRALFHDRAARCVEQYRRDPSRQFAILYLDVNDFKLVNDALGHDVGDAFLLEIAERLEGSVRQCEAVLARLGGDEFGVLLENIRNVDDATRIAERIQERMKPPVFVAEREILASISIGVVSVLPTNASVDELMRQADAAMYDAKQFSESGISVFDERMRKECDTRLAINSELKHAIRRDEFELHYQPIVDAETMKTAGFEALIRWHHPVHGNISPTDFIPIAESNGMIIEIGNWVLARSCEQCALWNENSDHDIMIAVNVSVRQLGVPGFVHQVESTLQATGLAPRLLKLEVTESLLMQKPNEMIDWLKQLQDMGVTTGIDDFGTGYSSLAYLHQMPLNVLKIDQSFVSDLAESRKHQAIVRSIIALARSLELQVIAEGIETANQAAYLQGLRCEYFQGFLYSCPVVASEASKLTQVDWSRV